VAGASQHILQSLIDFGFSFNRVDYQSLRISAYKKALEDLNNKGLLYACYCTRKALAGSPTCTGGCSTVTASRLESHSLDSDFKGLAAIRFRALVLPSWHDAIQTTPRQSASFDPVIWRKDGLVSYALACALDDSAGVTTVVRGSDLMHTTALQIGLMRALDRPEPRYAHVPVLVNSKQQKLSKQTAAEPLDAAHALSTLTQTWAFLGQTPINAQSVQGFWSAALDQWSLSAVPKRLTQ
jgi:glutamyl-Q tRNA(Asp) synthetase